MKLYANVGNDGTGVVENPYSYNSDVEYMRSLDYKSNYDGFAEQHPPLKVYTKNNELVKGCRVEVEPWFAVSAVKDTTPRLLTDEEMNNYHSFEEFKEHKCMLFTYQVYRAIDTPIYDKYVVGNKYNHTCDLTRSGDFIVTKVDAIWKDKFDCFSGKVYYNGTSKELKGRSSSFDIGSPFDKACKPVEAEKEQVNIEGHAEPNQCIVCDEDRSKKSFCADCGLNKADGSPISQPVKEVKSAEEILDQFDGSKEYPQLIMRWEAEQAMEAYHAQFTNSNMVEKPVRVIHTEEAVLILESFASNEITLTEAFEKIRTKSETFK